MMRRGGNIRSIHNITYNFRPSQGQHILYTQRVLECIRGLLVNIPHVYVAAATASQLCVRRAPEHRTQSTCITYNCHPNTIGLLSV
jgi:hypothetical protein